jgi:glucokinase
MEHKQIWGLDIGGTHLRIGLFINDCLMEIKKKKWDGDTIEQDKDTFSKLIESCKKEWGVPNAWGISYAGILSKDQSEVISWPTRSWWNGFLIKDYLFQLLTIPLNIEDDAASAILGELHYGIGKGKSNLIIVTVGTGIGGGMVINGKLYRGANGWAGDFGHMRVHGGDRTCTCGKIGCLQAHASGPAIFSYVSQLAIDKMEESEIWHSLINAEPWTHAAIGKAAGYTGQAIAEVVKCLDPELVVLGGGIIQQIPLYYEKCLATIQMVLKDHPALDVPIMRGVLGDDAGLYGAYSLVYKHVKE